MSNSDSFIDEVNEEVRRDRVYALVRKYGWIAVLLIIVIVGGAAFNEYRQAQARAQAEALGDEMLAALEENDADARQSALDAIGAETPKGQAVLDFMRAGELADDNPERAAQILEGVAGQADLPAIYRQIAQFKSLTLTAATRSIEERRAGLEDLAAPGLPLRPLAEEQLALIDVQSGDVEAALARLQSLLSDAEATPDLQQRVLQAIVALGGEPDLSGLVPPIN